MSVWFAIPSCRPSAEARACCDLWHGMGYRVALLRQGDPVRADLMIPTGEYLGWARSTNILARHICRIDQDAQFIVGGGDDYKPDPRNSPAIIAHDCYMHFGGTFGVMQPTGDRWGDDVMSRAKYGPDRGAYIDRVAGSPWMGRQWIKSAYLGDGPMWSGYHHCFADEELQQVAGSMGRFWQRRDLTQYHDHAGRTSFDVSKWPPHLAPAITGANWDRDKALFAERLQKGFPGCRPI